MKFDVPRRVFSVEGRAHGVTRSFIEDMQSFGSERYRCPWGQFLPPYAPARPSDGADEPVSIDSISFTWTVRERVQFYHPCHAVSDRNLKSALTTECSHHHHIDLIA